VIDALWYLCNVIVVLQITAKNMNGNAMAGLELLALVCQALAIKIQEQQL
jgi:hypothetical protein